MKRAGMDRREFVKAGVAATVVATLPAAAEAPKRARQPNVLYVFSDQHRAVSQPGEPLSEVIAPNIDAFRRSNFSMDTCISNYPLCTPYRGILMTGKYPCQSGLVHNSLKMKTSEVTLTQTFKAQGYHTGYVGKWHLGHDEQFTPEGPLRFGIDDWHVWGNTNDHYHAFTFDPVTGQKISPPGWNATSMSDQAVDFLKRQPKGPDAKPWMLMVSWNPPHPPFNPPDGDQQPYTGTLKKRPNVKLRGNGKTQNGKGGPLASEENLHKSMQGYFGGITGVDLEFARLLKTLEETGAADNTIVIYTSDHGEMLGSQGRMSKEVPYDESCHVPFAVRYPGVTVKGGSTKALFAAVDIYPTVCGLAGVPVPPHCAGQDMSGLMRGKTVAKAPDMVFLMCGGANSLAAGKQENDDEARMENVAANGENAIGKAPPYRGCRTATHTYAVDEKGRWLLFDNVADPYQMNNLTHDPAQKALMDGFDTRIKAWMKSTGDPFLYPSV